MRRAVARVTHLCVRRIHFVQRVLDQSRAWPFRLGALAIVLATVSLPASAQIPTNAFLDYEKLIRSSEMVSPLKDDLFGESISLYNGGTQFNAVDVDLRGNNTLPVRLGRRFKVDVTWTGGLTSGGFGSSGSPLGGFGGWDIDVPYVYGTFDMSYGWRTGSNAQTNRCSGAALPRVTSPFEVNEVWSGY